MKSDGDYWREEMGKEWEAMDGELQCCEHVFTESSQNG